jgi:hypothetical protein
MKYEVIPQVQVIRGGISHPWCSVITRVPWDIALFANLTPLASWVYELQSRPGFKKFTYYQTSRLVVIDISIYPNTPVSKIADFQTFLVHGLKRIFDIKAEIVPYPDDTKSTGR